MRLTASRNRHWKIFPPHWHTLRVVFDAVSSALTHREDGGRRGCRITLSLCVVATTPPYPARWSTEAETVAHGLHNTYGLCVDEEQTVYVAESGNHRIVAWKAGATTGEVRAGGNGMGNRLDQLNGPTDVIVDRETDTLLICDRGNRRVMRWPRRRPPSGGHVQGELVVDNIFCYGLTLDDQGALYVNDTDKHEVRRYESGGQDKQGTVVAGGHGAGANLQQLSWPTYLFVDAQFTLYVTDGDNHRVMKWPKGATAGIVVAGGNGKGEELRQLSSPRGVWVDGGGHVYVADAENHRVVRWEKGAKEGSVIAGGNGAGGATSQLWCPEGLCFDRHGHLYLAEYRNNRVTRFSLCL